MITTYICDMNKHAVGKIVSECSKNRYGVHYAIHKNSFNGSHYEQVSKSSTKKINAKVYNMLSAAEKENASKKCFLMANRWWAKQ